MTSRANPLIPNLFLVGVPKAATTSMHAWLSEHPEIFMSRLKELQFFAEDVLGHQRNVVTLEDYLGRFAAAERKRVIGEASTAYMVSRTAARRIKEFNPNARILIMLRHPIDAMYALHNKRVFSGSEHIKDFASAIESLEPRVWRSGPWKGQVVVRRPYKEVATFAPQLERYFEVFDREHIHIILHDDLCDRPAEVRNALQTFLGASRVEESELPHENFNRRVRHMHLQDWLRRPPHSIRPFVHAVLPTHTRRRLGNFIRKLNSAREPRVHIDEHLRERLTEECSSDIEEVARLLGRDLSAWLGGSRKSNQKYSFVHTSETAGV